MIVDLNHYLVNKPFIQNWYAEHGKDNPREVVSLFAPATHCPVIVLAFYISESVGFIPELVLQIESLIKFYGYTQIKNQPENSPFLELE